MITKVEVTLSESLCKCNTPLSVVFSLNDRGQETITVKCTTCGAATTTPSNQTVLRIIFPPKKES